MAIEIINVGASPNDGNGDPIRDAFIKCNDNFDELDTTKIGGSGTDNFVPKFNGTDSIENSLIFDDGSFVGVNTTTPSTNLEVNGPDYSFSAGRQASNRKVSIGLNDNGQPSIQSFDSSNAPVNLTINPSGGNVGVGTLNPLGLLHLYKSGVTTRMVIDGDAGQSKIITYRTGGLQRFGMYVNNTAESGSNAGSDFQIRAYNDAGSLLSTPFFIKRSSGNIGIGTTSPASKLDVINNSTYQLRLASNSSNYSSGGLYLGSLGTSDPFYYGFARWNQDNFCFEIGSQHGNNSGGITFLTGTGTASQLERMRILANGNVGIGTSDTFGFKTLINSGNSSNNLILFSTTSGVNLTFNDLNTGVGSQIVGVANDLYISTNNTERIRMTSGGNIGIGTSNPNRLLTISGTSSGLIGLNASSYRNTTIGSDSVGNFIVYDDTAAAYRMVINSNGNVGIGTTSPLAKLDVRGIISASNSGTDGSLGVALTFDNPIYPGTQNHRIRTSTSASASNNLLQFETSNGTVGSYNNNQLVLAGTGNVGIGTTSPSNALTITKSANSYLLDGLKVDRDPSTTSSSIFNAFGGGTNIISNSGQTSTFSPITFRASDNTTTNELMRITGSGNVGIGITAPTSKLQVVGLPEYATNALAIAGGLTVGAFYHTAGVLKVVI